MTNPFPKIIHQIWFQGADKIPDKYTKNIDTTRHNNQNFEYMLWDDEKIKNTLPEKHKQKYESFKYMHQKIDFAKYVILNMFGGVYIDIDAYSIKSLEPLLLKYQKYDMVVSKMDMNFIEKYVICRNKSFINNGIIISKKNIKSLNKLIDYFKNTSMYF